MLNFFYQKLSENNKVIYDGNKNNMLWNVLTNSNKATHFERQLCNAVLYDEAE